MSTDDKLEGFKISDMKKAEVRSFKKTVPARAGSDAAAEAANTGFDNIEDRLENSSIEAVADEIRKTYEQLEEMATKGDMKTKAAALQICSNIYLQQNPVFKSHNKYLWK